jgi:hypothetical protein
VLPSVTADNKVLHRYHKSYKGVTRLLETSTKVLQSDVWLQAAKPFSILWLYSVDISSVTKCYSWLYSVTHVEKSNGLQAAKPSPNLPNLTRHKGVTRVLQSDVWLQAAKPPTYGVSTLVEVGYKGVTRVLQGCYEGVTRVVQGCYKAVMRVLQE